MRIEQILRDGVAFFGSREALVADRIAWTYSDLDGKSDRLAAALLREGLKTGERVALYLENSPCAVVSLFAVLKAGLIAVPVEASTLDERVHSILTSGDIAAIITQSRLATCAAAALAGTPAVRVVVLVGGDRKVAPPAGCISFEKVTMARTAVSLPRLADVDAPAVVLGAGYADGDAAVPYTHASVVATSQSVEDITHKVQHSLASLYGFCGIVSALRGGATLHLTEPGQAAFVVRRQDEVPELLLAMAG